MFSIRSLLAAAALAVLSACASQPASVSVTDTITQNPNLGTLSKLIADAGLGDTLRGQGPFTVFAPSDEAFKAVPAKTMDELSKDPARLKAVLTYHVLPSKLMAADVKTMGVKSVNGADLALSKAGDFVTVEEAAVQSADIAATNGVVHVVDRVLMPPRR